MEKGEKKKLLNSISGSRMLRSILLRRVLYQRFIVFVENYIIVLFALEEKFI